MGKKILALLLCLCTVLPLATCAKVEQASAVISDMSALDPVANSSSTAVQPKMSVADLEKLTINYKFPNIPEEESKEIWEWAKQLVLEWNESYQNILKGMATEKDPTPIKRTDDMGKNYTYAQVQSAVKKNKEFTLLIRTDTHKQNYEYESGSITKWKLSRTLDTLLGWAESSYAKENFKQDEWGGFIDASMKQEATGYFYTKKINGRWWLITPSGYPTLMRAIMNVDMVKNDNADQQKQSIAQYGSEEKWAIATADYLKNELGLYTVNKKDDFISEIPVEEGFSYGTYGVNMATAYGLEKGIAWDAGSTYFDVNISYIARNNLKGDAHQVMPVFNRDFEEFADRQAKAKLYDSGAYLDSRIVVISSDNEIPIKADALERYFIWSNPEKLYEEFPDKELKEKIKVYYETYATTVTWILFMTGKKDIKNIVAKDYRDSDLSLLFLGFIYDRLLKVSSTAIKKYAPNHMYIGNRSLSGGESIDVTSSNSVLDREWIIRFSAQYIDGFGINWYGRWNPSPEESADLQKWTGDKPIFITEMGFKTDEGTGVPDPGYDNNGAGFWLKTMEDRANGFENFILNFMEWPNFVGYEYYEFRHSKVNGKYSGSQGIINDAGEYDPLFTASIAELNSKAYSLIRFLDYRQKNWSKYFK